MGGGICQNLDFGYFALIWQQSDKKQEIMKKSYKDSFILAELPIVWLIIGSDSILFQHRSQ